MIVTQPLDIADFSGGITDHIYRPNPTKSQVLDNFVIQSNRSVITRPGSLVDDTVSNGYIPAGNQRIGTLINYDNSDKLFVQSAKKIYYRNPSAYATLQGPTGNDIFSVGTTSSIVSFAEWNKHVFFTSDAYPRPMKMYKDNSSAYQLRSSGLPALASAPTVTAGAAGVRNYIYAFHYAYTYTVGTDALVFKDAGAITEVELTLSGDPSVNPNAITVIPVITNGVTENFDVTVIKVEIYRTVDAGDVFYKIGEVTNGTTTFNDNFADTAIQNNTLIYNSDGSVDNDAPPLSKFIHIVNNVALYGYLNENSQKKPFTLRQSIPGDPDSVPLDFNAQTEDEIAGISSVKSVPIVLCKKKIYRIEGVFDQFGRGGMQLLRLSDTAGCVSNQSCVQAEDGLFWAGNDGFYYTDGYVVKKISDDNNVNYKTMLAECTDTKRIMGRFDEQNRRIIWALQTDSASLDNDSCWVLDLRWGVRDDSTFTTWNAVTLSESFAPSAITFFNKQLYRADKRGYVFVHSDNVYNDPKVDVILPASQWSLDTIMWQFKSIAFNGGSNFQRKIATRIMIAGKNVTNVSIQINAINDDGKIFRALKEIRWRKNFVWGDPEFSWGDPSCVWNAEGLIEQWRRFPARGLRWSYLQIQVQNAYTIITNSDTLGTATFSAIPNTALLDDALTADWPEASIGYDMTTEVDGYTRKFPITGRTADTLTMLDPQNVLPGGSLKWEIMGYPKSEVFNMLGLTLHWASLSKSQSTFETGDSGGNT